MKRTECIYDEIALFVTQRQVPPKVRIESVLHITAHCFASEASWFSIGGNRDRPGERATSVAPHTGICVRCCPAILIRFTHGRLLSWLNCHWCLRRKRTCRAVVHIDETGSKENGKRRWTWCFRAKDFTVFHVA
ncbi:MAG: hypothetical protein LBI05_02270, partial [Planctomycetaceae bacterium]|nr:hypothetical protein [Planctomycetaceae bacterium]